jgi:hypothetical protein
MTVSDKPVSAGDRMSDGRTSVNSGSGPPAVLSYEEMEEMYASPASRPDVNAQSFDEENGGHLNPSDQEDGQQDEDADENSDHDGTDDIMDRKWRESPFAVGLTKPTWEDEDIGCYKTCLSFLSGSKDAHIHFSGLICGKCRAGRVGNMVVLLSTREAVLDDDGRRVGERPLIRCTVGPYWPVTVCLTVPGIVGYALYAGFLRGNVWEESKAGWFYIWACLNSLALLSLFLVSCSNPGILYRCEEPQEETWTWNDQALTYRPPYAKFDPECAVMIDHFDHTCPWTGTAIGKRNMRWFRVFVCAVFASAIFNTIVIVFL